MAVLSSFFALGSAGLAKEAAPLPAPLKNPHTKGTDWFHGTTTNFRHDLPHGTWDADTPAHEVPSYLGKDPGGDLEPPTHQTHRSFAEPSEHHWNSDLGVHFTSRPNVAHEFASGSHAPGDGDPGFGRVAHTRLHIGNPKHYDSESDMTQDAVKWAHDNGHYYGGLASKRNTRRFVEGEEEHAALFPHHEPAMADLDTDDREHIAAIDNDDYSVIKKPVLGHNPGDHYLRYHPQRDEIVHGFRDHLQEQGHDGITYRNDYESAGHHCAIAFHPHQIHIQKWDWTGDHQEHLADPKNWGSKWDQPVPDFKQHTLPGLEHVSRLMSFFATYDGTLYHGTSEDAAGQIERNGLQEHSYLSPNRETATMFAQSVAGCYDWGDEHGESPSDCPHEDHDPPVVLKVNGIPGKGQEVEHPEPGRAGGFAYSDAGDYVMAHDRIPAERISRHASYGPQPAYDDEADFDTNHQRRKDWKANIRAGLSRGELTNEQAKTHGYSGTGHDQDHMGRLNWKSLPHTLYHVTTNKDAVLKDKRLRSRDELGQKHGGSGLGGGESDTISFTDDLDVAHHIHRALHEYHSVVTGKKPIGDVLDEAHKGGWLDSVHSVVGKDNADAAREGRQVHFGLPMTQDEAKEKIHPEAKPHAEDEGWTRPDGTTLHSRWTSPMSDEEKMHRASSIYTAHAAMREINGGPMDPGFMFNSAKAMAESDPSKFGIVRVHPKPGAQGYQVRALGEWRTADGSTTPVAGEEPSRHHANRLSEVAQAAQVHADSLPRCTGCGAAYHSDEPEGEFHDHWTAKTSSYDAQDFGDTVKQTFHKAQGHLPNPYHDHAEWFHGTSADYEGAPDIDKSKEYYRKHLGTGQQTNKLLGTHWSSLHAVAHGFAQPNADKDSRVFHAHLAIKNPIHFETEHGILHHLWNWGSKAGVIKDPKHDSDFMAFNYGQGTTSEGIDRRLSEFHKNDRTGRLSPERKHQIHANIASSIETHLQHHPRHYEIAKGYVEHLKDQGIDGITYGNLVEGPKHHISAITLDKGQAEVTHTDNIPAGKHHHDHVRSIHGEPRDLLNEVERYHNGGRLRDENPKAFRSTGPGNTGKGEYKYSKVAGAKSFFHATPYNLDDQSHILPPAETGRDPHWEDMDPSEAHRVFFTGSEEEARGWGTEISDGPSHIYEVEPEGEVTGKHVLSAPRARIIRRVSGANGDLPEDLTLDEPRYNSMLKAHDRVVLARHDGRLVGTMQWQPDGEILDVRVHPDYRRRGVADAMWNHAHSREEYEVKPRHSKNRSDSGEGWAQSHGGVEPRVQGEGIDESYANHHWAGAQGDLPEDLTFSVHYRHPEHPRIRMNEGEAWAFAHADGKNVGGLRWNYHSEPSEVMDVTVSPSHQRRGIGTALFNWVKQNHQSDLEHSDTLTDDGRSFRQSFGSLLPGYIREHSWLPDHGIFSPTKATLDPALFDKNERMHPFVKKTILARMNKALRKTYPDWRQWTRNYLAGGEASYWWGNRDADVLVGIDYPTFREAHPEDAALSDEEISAKVTGLFRAGYNDENWVAPWDGQIWHATAYSNPASWNIKDIKPYSAYLIDTDEWTVRPPKVSKKWGAHEWDEGIWNEAEGYRDAIHGIAQIQDPAEQARRGAALYEHLHSSRRQAFGASGKGWKDGFNAVWKYLEYHPEELVGKLVEWARQNRKAAA